MRREPTNIKEEIEYIKTLPVKQIRGLQLPYDDFGFYIVWPGDNYFKKRVTIDSTKTRYIGPRGHRAPLLVYPPEWSKHGYPDKGIKAIYPRIGIIVEGELNAISLYESGTNTYTIISSGSATELPKTLDYALTFDTIVIIVDKDIPGVGWGANLKHELIKHQKKVQLVAVEKDVNQILQDSGKEGVQKWFKENVGLPRGVQSD